jgi:predicted DNA-binding ribbon-helix-helix protein
MRTTVRLDEALIIRAKNEAARRGVTLTSLIEQGLKSALTRPQKKNARSHVQLPVCKMKGGTLPGINIDRMADLLDRLESDR